MIVLLKVENYNHIVIVLLERDWDCTTEGRELQMQEWAIGYMLLPKNEGTGERKF